MNFSKEFELAYEELNKLLVRYDYFMTIDYADIKAILNKKAKESFKEKHPELNTIKATNELMELIKNYIIEVAGKYSIS